MSLTENRSISSFSLVTSGKLHSFSSYVQSYKFLLVILVPNFTSVVRVKFVNPTLILRTFITWTQNPVKKIWAQRTN